MKFTYKEKQYNINFEGNEYAMARRTPAAMERIKALSTNKDMTEYENNMELLKVLFGAEAAQQMFPDSADVNLDKLAAFSAFVLDIFLKEYKELQAQRTEKELKPYTDTLKTLETVSKLDIPGK